MIQGPFRKTRMHEQRDITADCGAAPTRTSQTTPDAADILNRVVAGRRVADSLAAAVAAGALRPQEDGAWLRPGVGSGPSDWVKESRDASRKCRFHMGVMFDHVYRKRQVPAGCATCFKVKVAPRTLRELVALRDVGHALPYTYKCGLDAAAPFTSGIYGGYFYLHGVDAARTAYQAVRAAVSDHPKLGPATSVFIKRGCTEYEMSCGPSDQYTFTPEQAGIEAAILTHIRIEPGPTNDRNRVKQTMIHWIKTAYRLGDETYRDFTGGRRLYPAVVRYEPPAPDAGATR
jgi:hypothetical protein